ncbi:dephospho-CoA kinase [Actinomyces viscosus]|uniref:Dephospho-CoA kinase n=1 Tax=Actinomyces viscosus TaxID=1656 RepID=A0A3S4WIU2_ACTVI|nr:dephospho-CoA kinase [Actinomyces viscosus]TFH53876.1 dephospho-CoA kinase [Actinomyces viscosus]VEI14987.1 Dephospho-CoA kinase [Actinomyces viscosus]
MHHTSAARPVRRPTERALRVGLTGGIGAGKSTVAALLAEHGAVVTSADDVSRDVVNPGSDGLAAVVAEFGDGILDSDGSLDRRALGRVVFSDELRLARLEEILLPLIAAEAWARMETVPAGQVAVYDVPLLVEGQMQDLFDLVVVVEADLELRLERLAERGMERDEALARIASQATDEQRRAVADVVLINSRSTDELKAEVDRLWRTRIMEPEGIA